MYDYDPKIIVALDNAEVIPVIENIDPRQCAVKIGNHMFTKFGPALIRRLKAKHFNVFIDLKFHDIPKTVADAVEAAADLGVWMINLHALGGRRMMEAAKERLEKRNYLQTPKLIAVTVLTSMEQADLEELGIMHTPESLVWALSGVAYKAGLDGVVCSPKEVSSMRYRADMDNNFITVVPGIRPVGSAANDQKRFDTPAQAIRDGASYLVIGRPITEAEDPAAALQSITNEIETATDLWVGAHG